MLNREKRPVDGILETKKERKKIHLKYRLLQRPYERNYNENRDESNDHFHNSSQSWLTILFCVSTFSRDIPKLSNSTLTCYSFSTIQKYQPRVQRKTTTTTTTIWGKRMHMRIRQRGREGETKRDEIIQVPVLVDGTRWTASNCFSMSRPVVNLFLGAMIGTGRTEPDKCASVTRKIGRKVFRVCWMSGHYRSYLADNGRPKVFKSVAAFICEQAAANVATRRGLGDPTTFLPLFPLSFPFALVAALFFFIIIFELTP